jgi:hypothetical protein
VAAQYYRDHLKNKIKGGNQKSMLVQQPEFEQGRQRSNQQLTYTKQIVPYSNLVHRDILSNLMKKEELDKEQKFNLNDHFS